MCSITINESAKTIIMYYCLITLKSGNQIYDQCTLDDFIKRTVFVFNNQGDFATGSYVKVDNELIPINDIKSLEISQFKPF